jgi:hypothetical protein
MTRKVREKKARKNVATPCGQLHPGDIANDSDGGALLTYQIY